MLWNVRPALHYAAQGDCLEAATLLVTAGAKINSITADGYLPLDIAKINGSLRMVKFLGGSYNFFDISCYVTHI